MTKKVDRVFAQPDRHLFETFEFTDEVAAVFDDMVSRSVPAYGVIQSLVAELALRLHDGDAIYDLGCSTGTTFEAILERASEPLKLVGVDDSRAMLDACREKLDPLLCNSRLDLEQCKLEHLEGLSRGRAGVVILSLILQFLRPVARLGLLRAIHRDLRSDGCVLLVEKTLQPDRFLNTVFLDTYHAYKRMQGYSFTEIARKREALENKLIPFYEEENKNMLREAGFGRVATFFTWMNFQGYLALK